MVAQRGLTNRANDPANLVAIGHRFIAKKQQQTDQKRKLRMLTRGLMHRAIDVHCICVDAKSHILH